MLGAPVSSQVLRKAFGVFLLLCTALIWVAASFISEKLVSNKGGSDASEEVPPFLLTYLATTLFTIYLPIVHFRIWLLEYRQRRWVPTAGLLPNNTLPALFFWGCL